MGLLRFILALSVVIAHSAPIAGLKLVPGDTAVQAFFIISGFYISMILHGRYPSNLKGTLLFYSNRFLRIYPLYWIVLLISIIQSSLSFVSPSYFTGLPTFARILEFFPDFDVSQILFIATTNLAIIGLDVGNFLRFDVSPMQLTSNFIDHAPRFYEFLFIPQAWTLSIEVFMYCFAPFLFRQPVWILLCLFIFSLLARAVAFLNGFDYDPFTYRFFPFEAALFLLGALSFRAFQHVRILKTPFFGQIGLAVALFLIIIYNTLPESPSFLPGFATSKFLFLFFIAAAIPSIFHFTHSNNLDRYIGELSYPIYLCHLIIITFCNGSFGPFNIYPAVGSIALSIILVALVDLPLARLRERRVLQVHRAKIS